MPGVARTDLGKRSVGNMKRLHLSGAVRTNFPKYPGFFGKAVRESARYEAVTSFRGSPDQFSGKAVRESARKCDEEVSRFRFIE